MSNSAIYTVNSTQPVLAADSQIPFGSVRRRFGKNLQLDGDSIILCGAGYYDCDIDVVVAPAAIGPVTVQLLLDGEPVPGAFTTQYAAAATNPVALNLAAPIIRICGCECQCNKTLGVQISAAATLVNMGASVKKL